MRASFPRRRDRADYPQRPRHHGGGGGRGDELMPGEKWSEPSVTDTDRLPWLETAGDDYEDGPALSRVIGMVRIGLVGRAAGRGRIYWFKHRAVGPGKGDPRA